MGVRPALFAAPGRAPLSNRESPARRIGVILSILFLGSVGTVATVTSARASGQEQADAGIAIAAPATDAAR